MTAIDDIKPITHAEWNATHPAEQRFQGLKGDTCTGEMELDTSGVLTCLACGHRVIDDRPVANEIFVQGRHDREGGDEQWMF